MREQLRWKWSKGVETIFSRTCKPLLPWLVSYIIYKLWDRSISYATASLTIVPLKYLCFCSFLDFQKKVLRCFAELKDLLLKLGKVYEPEESDFFLKTVQTFKEYQELEEALEDQEKNKLMVSSAFSWLLFS